MNEYHWLEDMKRQRVRKGIMHPKSIPFARKKNNRIKQKASLCRATQQLMQDVESSKKGYTDGNRERTICSLFPL